MTAMAARNLPVCLGHAIVISHVCAIAVLWYYVCIVYEFDGWYREST